MIKDKSIRFYILKNFIEYAKMDLRFVSAIVYAKLKRKYVKNEEVYVKNKEDCVRKQEGIVIGRVKDKYIIEIKKDNTTHKTNIECVFDDLSRKWRIDEYMIYNFLCFITYESIIGFRLLKKNVYQFVITGNDLLKKDGNVDSVVKSGRYMGINVKYCGIMNGHDRRYNDSRYRKENMRLIDNQRSTNTMREYGNNDIKSKSLLEQEMEMLKLRQFRNNKVGDTTNKEINFPLEGATATNRNMNKENIIPHEEGDKFIYNDITVDIPKSEILEYPDMDYNLTSKVIKIYAFVSNFLPYKNISLNKLIKSYKEIPYTSETTLQIHQYFIDKLLEERNHIKMSGILQRMKTVIDSLSEIYESEEVIIGNEVGLQGWRLRTKAFLLEIYKNTSNKKILSFYNVLNKKTPFDIETTISLRISLTDFLINCYMTTDIFRDLIIKEISTINELEKKLEIFEKQNNKSKIYEIRKKLIRFPTKTEIGLLNNGKFMFVDDTIYYTKNKVFYTVSRSTILKILEKYQPSDKVEATTITNLRNILEIIE